LNAQVEKRLDFVNLTTKKSRYDYVIAALPMEVDVTVDVTDGS